MHVYRATNSGTPTVLYPFGSFQFNRISQTRLDISSSPARNNFGYDNDYVKQHFLHFIGDGHYELLPAFENQRLVENHFETMPEDEWHLKIKNWLLKVN